MRFALLLLAAATTLTAGTPGPSSSDTTTVGPLADAERSDVQVAAGLGCRTGLPE
jgi:hypothetical protein